MNQDYTIYLYMPAGYGSSAAGDPVIYVLDGDTMFDDVSAIAENKYLAGKMPETIVAGIGYGSGKNMRGRDYTPPSSYHPAGQVGRVGYFFGFLESELIPWMEAQYRVRSDAPGRTFIGHSYGGLAGAYGMFHKPSLFGRYLLCSPSLFWGDRICFGYEADYAQAYASLPVKLFISSGSQEAVTDEYILELTARLISRNYALFSMEQTFIKGASHNSAVKQGLRLGLDYLFAGWIP
jgi:predicted alpha/beta superfamily hydrolase